MELWRLGGVPSSVEEVEVRILPNAVTKEKAAEIAADFMTTFYDVQVGAVETRGSKRPMGFRTVISDRFGTGESERNSDNRLRTSHSGQYEDVSSVHFVSGGFSRFDHRSKSETGHRPQKLAGPMTGRSLEE